ncbi:hypothetical protein SETIT_9G046400v2 [Setaria italica]|uniref:DUF6821 domain-containing protein n=3 Tax=Setaria TaxID=4554 RepID=A0A368SD33_SETIT|nr:uncharacterized protein LOC101783775 isoform X2 [Setaria italica]RCV40356.1 hypothetical protein SETIT_9G046400v2 [Setaria italica]
MLANSFKTGLPLFPLLRQVSLFPLPLVLLQSFPSRKTQEGASMDAISLDEWELLPDHKSSFFLEEDCSNGSHGAVGGDEEAAAKKPLLLPSQDACVHDPDIEFMDIAALLTDPKREELVSKVTEILIYEAEDHDDEMVKSPDGVKEADQDEVLVEAPAPDDQRAREEEEGVSRTGFSVGNLRVNGVGALCSFGVAAATFVIFLLGGKEQQKRHQDHKIQLQMYADDERIQQVVQQASRLNQTMSSVMGGASSARASISFGGYYQGF